MLTASAPAVMKSPRPDPSPPDSGAWKKSFFGSAPSVARNVSDSIGGYRLLEEAFNLIDEDGNKYITPREFSKFSRVVARDGSGKFEVFAELERTFDAVSALSQKETQITFEDFMEHMNVPFGRLGEKRMCKAVEIGIRTLKQNQKQREKRNMKKTEDGWLEVGPEHLEAFLTDLGDDVADLVGQNARDMWGPLRRQSILDSAKSILAGEGMQQLMGKGFPQDEDERWFAPLCGKFADAPVLPHDGKDKKKKASMWDPGGAADPKNRKSIFSGDARKSIMSLDGTGSLASLQEDDGSELSDDYLFDDDFLDFQPKQMQYEQNPNKSKLQFTSRGPREPRGERIPFHEHEAWYEQKKSRQQRQMEWRVWMNMQKVMREQSEVKEAPTINSSSRDLASSLRPFHERADEKMLQEFEGHIRQRKAKEYISAEERDEMEFTGFPELSHLTNALGATPGGKVSLSASERSKLWEERRERNMQRLRMEQMRDDHGGQYHRPHIDEKSQMIFKIFRQTDEPVHERLWREYQEKTRGEKPRRVGGVKQEEYTHMPEISKKAQELNRYEFDGQTVFERLYLAPGAGRRAEIPPPGLDEPPPGYDAENWPEELEKKQRQMERREKLAQRSRERQMIQEEGNLWDRLHDYGRTQLEKREQETEEDEEENFPYRPEISKYAQNIDREGCTYERLYKYGAGNTSLQKKTEEARGDSEDDDSKGPWRRRVTHLIQKDAKPYMPTISPMAKNISRDGDVFQRMYDARKDGKDGKDSSAKDEEQFPFKPAISAKAHQVQREGDIYERLHKNEGKTQKQKHRRSSVSRSVSPSGRDDAFNRLYRTTIKHQTVDHRNHERRFSKAIVVPFGTSTAQHSAFQHGEYNDGDMWDAETGMFLHPGGDAQFSRVKKPLHHLSQHASHHTVQQMRSPTPNKKRGKDGPFSRSPGPMTSHRHVEGTSLNDAAEQNRQIYGVLESAADRAQSAASDMGSSPSNRQKDNPFAKQRGRSATPKRGDQPGSPPRSVGMPSGARRPLPTPAWEPAEAELSGRRASDVVPELAGLMYGSPIVSSQQALATENARLREELRRAKENQSMMQSQSQKALPQTQNQNASLSSSQSAQDLGSPGSPNNQMASSANPFNKRGSLGGKPQRKPNKTNAFKQPGNQGRDRTPPPAEAANPFGHPAFGGKQGVPGNEIEAPKEGAANLSEQHAEISNVLSAARRNSAASKSPPPKRAAPKKANKAPEKPEPPSSYGQMAVRRASLSTVNEKEPPSYTKPTAAVRNKQGQVDDDEVF